MGSLGEMIRRLGYGRQMVMYRVADKELIGKIEKLFEGFREDFSDYIRFSMRVSIDEAVVDRSYIRGVRADGLSCIRRMLNEMFNRVLMVEFRTGWDSDFQSISMEIMNMGMKPDFRDLLVIEEEAYKVVQSFVSNCQKLGVESLGEHHKNMTDLVSRLFKMIRKCYGAIVFDLADDLARSYDESVNDYVSGSGKGDEEDILTMVKENKEREEILAVIADLESEKAEIQERIDRNLAKLDLLSKNLVNKKEN